MKSIVFCAVTPCRLVRAGYFGDVFNISILLCASNFDVALKRLHDKFYVVYQHVPMTVAERSKARNVFARSNAGIVGSNTTQKHGCLYMRLFCVCVVLCVGSYLATG
jgi:hypothetical protein